MYPTPPEPLFVVSAGGIYWTVMDLLELLRFQARRYRCSACGENMADCGINVLAQQGNRALVRVTCASCNDENLLQIIFQTEAEEKQRRPSMRVFRTSSTRSRATRCSSSTRSSPRTKAHSPSCSSSTDAAIPTRGRATLPARMASLDPGQDMVFDRLYGLEFGETTPEHMTATCPVTPKVLQPFGIVHGGVFCSMAETITSVGTYIGVHEAGEHLRGDV